ncbi:2,5-diamino-6-(ribosylamino)-4(3H)-pyrimidinone 5'-phosphate reductase [Geoglobus acetivorans]|uniref:2,5-diamino-6-(ribosylamino)-4(3H)-pyrimidinone 5'-phosphate reductase n=1 Tax=Geoglobus acetivorans TaxID=565033 RepID=A0ABZ3H4Y2_GEOAI|nr:2,5-diamino-6-(ribosylamino)-4(3H)-pyrimidinone 5'-phosphate reductase [Geoglobus acetivorans]
MRRPFVFINSAVSLDGKISNERREQVKISSPEDFAVVDKLRAESDAILVGIGTVLSDDPKLTVKNPDLREERVRQGLPPNPVRVVADSLARTPLNAQVLNSDARTVIAVSERAEGERIEKLKEKAEIVVAGKNRVDLKALMEYLWDAGIRKLMVEGGSEINYTFIKEGLVDEIRVFYSGIVIGGAKAPTLVSGKSFDVPVKFKIKSCEILGNGVAVVWSLR